MLLLFLFRCKRCLCFCTFTQLIGVIKVVPNAVEAASNGGYGI